MNLIINIDSNSIECDIVLNEHKYCYITVTITKKKISILGNKKLKAKIAQFNYL